jgi:hypothetical protein
LIGPYISCVGKSKRVGDLDLQYDPAYEEREWIAQRIGWAFMGSIAIAGLIGLLGHGPLSKKTEGKIGDRLHVKYQRFARYQAPSEVKVYCRPGGKEQFEIGFERGFIERSEIKEISPEPEETRSDGEQYVYRFKRGEGEEHLVTFRMEGNQFGKASSKVTLDGGASVKLQIFFWP